ncbi:hypothetical protein THAOC_09544 [Thalassiosira oceanica]|uniref:Uncharacterized protein n=1 Tax=Thalassiosira oceanica TaxID=159749 RepID=K0SUY7_THAOC|nr:hypothetical protein THAOC_09544 [Thalassiosira oceanica]|eukprot:EJK69215.1 hypothetical protein THAOC_09544 [Thalassiosira oceanica]
MTTSHESMDIGETSSLILPQMAIDDLARVAFGTKASYDADTDDDKTLPLPETPHVTATPTPRTTSSTKSRAAKKSRSVAGSGSRKSKGITVYYKVVQKKRNEQNNKIGLEIAVPKEERTDLKTQLDEIASLKEQIAMKDEELARKQQELDQVRRKLEGIRRVVGSPLPRGKAGCEDVTLQQDCHERVDKVDVDVAGQRGILRDSQAREDPGACRGVTIRRLHGLLLRDSLGGFQAATISCPYGRSKG